MKPSPILSGFFVTCLACFAATSACTQALLGDKEYVLDQDGSSSSGGAGASENTGATSSSPGGGGGAGGLGPLACEKGFTACGASCVMLEADVHHCGECAHDCLGTDCNEGLCKTGVVAANLPGPQRLALDATHVYWTNADGTVQRAPKSGGVVEIVADGQDAPGAIAVDATHVFWANEASGRVMRAPKDLSKAPKMLFKGDGLRSLAIDTGNVYLSRKLKKGDIRKVKKGGDGPKKLAEAQPDPSELQLLGEQLIWSGFIEADGMAKVGDELPGGYVRSVSRQGGDIVSLAEGEGQIVGLTVIGGTALWADTTNQRIRMRLLTGDAPSTLVDEQQVRGLAADSTRVFWTTAGGTVRQHPLAAGSTRLLAVEVMNAGAIAVDDSHVYFVRSGDGGAVLRVAK